MGGGAKAAWRSILLSAVVGGWGCGDGVDRSSPDDAPDLGDAGVGDETPVEVFLRIALAGDGEGTVDATVAGELLGACDPTDAPCVFRVQEGTEVSLSADPMVPSRFGGWSGGPAVDCPGTGPCTVVVVTDTEVTGTFLLDELAVRVAVDGDGDGLVVSDPESIDCGEACVGTWDAGTEVTLTATPATSSELTSWGGACEGAEGDTCTLALADEDLDVTATFALRRYPVTVERVGGGEGTVAEAVAGIDCGDVCSVEVDHGTMLMPTATPAPSSIFSGWEGCTTTDPECVVVVTGETTIRASFALAPRALAVALDGSGEGTVTSDPAGIDCGTDCDEAYLHGDEVTLTAAPDSDTSRFLRWTGDCSGASATCTVTMDQDRQAVAEFALLPRGLTVDVLGNGAGTVTSAPAGVRCGNGATDCDETFDHGTMVTLTASPVRASSFFAGWGGDGCSSAASTCTVEMDRARDVTATFTAFDRTLTVDPEGPGTVTSSPAGIDCGPDTADCDAKYAHGTMVTLTAAPGAAARFVGWGGACAGTSTTCTIDMTGDRTVTATFRLITYRLDVTAVATRGGTGTVSSTDGNITRCGPGGTGTCAHTYVTGSRVTLEASPGTNAELDGWSGGGCSGTGASCTLTMDRARSVTATFQPAQRTLSVSVSRVAGTSTVDLRYGGTITSCGAADCDVTVDHGTVVDIIVDHGPGGIINDWGGACRRVATTSTICRVTMTADQDASVELDMFI